MGDPFIIQRRSSFKIVCDGPKGRFWWNAKNGEWLGSYCPGQRESIFRSREAAELELKRIRLKLTPEYPKSKLRKL